MKTVLFVCVQNSGRNQIAEICPASFVPTGDWELDDPEGKPIEEVRHIIAKTKARVKELIEGFS